VSGSSGKSYRRIAVHSIVACMAAASIAEAGQQRALALSRFDSADRLVSVGGGEFDHHGQPLSGVVYWQVGDLGHLAQPVTHRVLVHS
jgi:hypothetical protein